MTLSNEQLVRLREELAAAKTPEDISEISGALGLNISAEDAADLLEKIRNKQVSDDTLEAVRGGFGEEVIPNYDEIKAYYLEKGPNLAFTLCIYYIPSPLCYEIVDDLEANGVPG